MRTINFDEYNQKRKSSKINFLKMRDQLERKPSSTFRKRDPEKQLLLFKMAKKRKDRLFKKIGEREYELRKEGGTNER
ncbi:MAG: hypothetical protein ACH0QD_00025 [Tepidibacillus sp.]